MALHIKSIEAQKMMMVLDNDSQWQFFPAKPPSAWRAGDQVAIEKKEGRFSLYRVVNKARKEEAGVVPIGVPGDLNKSLKIGSGEQYANLDTEITIKDASGELIWLRDGSKWQMYNPALGDPGSWEIGGAVIVTRRVAKSMSKIYQMKNVNTGINLMAVFLGYEQ